MSRLTRERLDALVDEATVDAYGEDEQVMGFYAMIADRLATPLRTTVLGVEVTVDDIGMSGRFTIVARCSRGALRQAIPILDVPLPLPTPVGAEWIEAHRYWAS